MAGPVEFGRRELDQALAARGYRPGQIRIRTEVAMDAPDSYRIAPGLITGGDLRGLMYGLLEAADQIRDTGHLRISHAAPAVPIRGIRIFLHNHDLEQGWYYSRDYWQEFFAMLARCRFNRFNLVFAHQTSYLAPPYPYWAAVPEFPDVRVPGLGDAARDRNLEMLRYISQAAEDYGIDFTLGIWEHNVQPGMTPAVSGLTPANIGPYSYAALRRVLAACPVIRSVQVRTNDESGIPPDRQVGFYRDFVFRAIRESGRRVTLDLRAWSAAPGLLEAAKAAGVPLRVSAKYWAEHLGRPYQPAETFPGYSYGGLLGKPRPYDFFWEVWALGSHRLLLWGDPAYVRRAVSTFTLSGSRGFEIDPPLAQKGFGNAPGQWGVFADSQNDRVFWQWEFQRYWMFYLLWGRLSYDPNASERLWTAELKRRFGAAAGAVLGAYQASGGVLNEIVAAHMPDPNMYVWPEINTGGPINTYENVPSSDWRQIASIREAARNRLEGIASAKQTPLETAAWLDDLAARTETAVSRAASQVAPGNREWLSSEPDFRVLALLARYHARKQTAAAELAWFDETADPAALQTARRELTAAAGLWERLVRLTDGLYPAGMAYGPKDTGYWKDKLGEVRHDLDLVEERARLLERWPRFDFTFDLTAAQPSSEAAGFGWLGARAFRVRTGEGPFSVSWLRGNGEVSEDKITAANGYLDLTIPGGQAPVSRLVLKGPRSEQPIPARGWPRRLPRPAITHTPPVSAAPRQPLVLTLRITPAGAARVVRLWYRPLNQLATFKSIESPAGKAVFAIPAEDLSPRWDLMYYFEILDRQGSGWFEPDPRVRTPYYVVASP